ncbi:MAG: glycine--tRNA ligase subunit beta, partial [Alphaproteobacteria bacterium]
MPDLLFELFSEEIPARMQSGAAKKMLESLERKLGEAGLKFDQSEAFYGPRRLTLAIAGLPDKQEDRIEERKGPKEDASDQAIQGFLRGAGLVSLDDAELRATEKGNIWFTKKYIQGIDTKTALPSLLLELINEHSWPKSQRWAKTSFRWVRPLRRILAVFDGEALKGHLELGGGEILPFTAEAEGHRFLGNGIFQVDSVKTLEKRLGDHFCVLRADERRKRIERQLRSLCDAANLTLIEDDGLLEEV